MTNDRSWAAQTSGSEDLDWGSTYFPSVIKEIVREQLYQMDAHKLISSDRIHMTGFSGPLSTTHKGL